MLVLAAPAGLRPWVADRFARVLDRAARAVLGDGGRIELVAEGEGVQPGGRDAAPVHPGGEATFNPKLTFEQFVIGASNRFAHAAALAVAELPGQAYNPLFLVGPPGVGKSHLLHSIGNYVQAHGDGLTVRYATAERFTNEFVTAIRAGDVDAFKGRFRRTDVLLVDDVQFLQAKARTEEEFFHTFNALHDAGSQLVLTSDRTPRDLGALEDRLRERFESGLVCEIAPPDRGVRLAVLRKRAQHDRVELADPAVLERIAERVTANVRALEGALIRVVAFHSLTGRPIDAGLVAEVLDGLYPAEREPAGATRAAVTAEQIQALTAEAFGLTREELLSASRAARVAWPRQVAMYLAREHTEESLPALGRAFGGRGHTTVMHAWRRAGERLATDPEAFEVVHRLSARLRDPDRGG